MQRRGILALLFAALGFFILGNFLTLAFPAAGLVVLLARGLEGIAFAIGAIAGPALASRSATRRDLGFVTGLMAAWIPIGQLFATGLALVLASWQMLWLAGAGATVLLGLWAPGAPPPRCLRHARRDRARAGPHQPAPALRAHRRRLDLPALVDAIFRLYDLAPPISGRGHGPGQYGGDGGLCAARGRAAGIQHPDRLPAGRRRAAGGPCCSARCSPRPPSGG